MSLAVAGHGATLDIELFPIVPGAFTAIAELNGDIQWPELMRPYDETTPHQDTIDSGVTGRLARGALTFTVNDIFNNSTHDHLTGLVKHIIENDVFGIRLRGPGGSASTNEWIASGKVTNYSKVDPVRQGARTAGVTIQLVKAMRIDGVTVGQAI